MSTSDFWEQKKAEEAAEKELKIDRWVYATIGWRADHKTGLKDHTLYSFDLPVHIYEKYQWVINWRKAKLQCQWPRIYLVNWCCYYDRNSKMRLHSDTILKRLISSKGWITRLENALNEYIEEQSQTLFFDPETDDKCRKARAKLEQKKANVVALQLQYDEAVAENKRYVNTL